MASILGLSRGDQIAVLYRSYIDDSKDQFQQDIVTAGAVIGAHGDWPHISQSWKARLRRDRLKYFRSTDYYSLRGEFELFRDPVKYPKPSGSNTAKALRDDLEKILRNAPVVGVGVAIPIKMYREFRESVPGAAQKFGSDIFYSALQTIMIECGWIVRDQLPLGKNGKPNRLSFIYDKDERAAFYGALFDDFQQRNPIIGESMNGLVGMDDKTTPAVQSADMMASLTKELVSPLLPMLNAKGSASTHTQGTAPRLQGTAYKIICWDWNWMETLLAAQSFGELYATIKRKLKRGE